ncbi:PglL family O-oligosaccharyltransferase [Marinobacter orientalis]|uniref:Virulence factor membrane-bound polymerase C-terminal domain-containing protein n=1 Tax=Marinobacter orientalis TaxID=1928859 RepID=A0A7Y0RFB7_9GAMM|nr:Wzy polymerase domain-containing protein [Marinobacter orientalis]NMT65212.1 hypothetical protein [Marinobacter orientalis]TGX48018.1 hypothetical protein DIT72_16545 [Marinobacter orientalis]
MNRTIASFIFVCLSFLVLAFVFPVGLYPFQDESRDFFAFIAAVALVFFVLYNRSIKMAFPFFLVFLPLFAGALILTDLASAPGVDLSFNWYSLVFLFCTMIAIAIASLARTYGPQFIAHNLALFLIAVFLLSAFFGLLRFYGVLGTFIPLITEDGSRLMGPMGQPNLMAILSALSLSAMVYLFRADRLGVKTAYAGAVLIFYVGALTASRSWYIAAFIALVPLILDTIRGLLPKSTKPATYGEDSRKVSAIAILVLFLIVSYGAPKLDAVIASSMIESGFLERVTAEEIYQRKSIAGSTGRLAEWSKVVLNLDKMDNILVGYGPGQYGTFSNQISVEESLRGNTKVWNHSHNIFINFFVEWGVVGFVLIVSFFGYVAFRALRTEKTAPNIFLISVISIFVFHSLVEFSLWYLPFLAIFIAALTLLDARKGIDAMSGSSRKIVSGILILVFLPLGFYVGKDIYTVIKVMYKDQPIFDDQLALRDASRSSLVGHGAYSVRILRFSPPASGIKYELEAIEQMVNWRPEPLYRLRHAVLLAAAGRTVESCEAIEQTIMLYPDTVTTLQEELAYLDAKGLVDASQYFQCVGHGVEHWVEKSAAAQ